MRMHLKSRTLTIYVNYKSYLYHFYHKYNALKISLILILSKIIRKDANSFATSFHNVAQSKLSKNKEVTHQIYKKLCQVTPKVRHYWQLSESEHVLFIFSVV